jgi:hypothetical protein
MLDRKIEGIYDIGGPDAARDNGWTPIDHAVVHAPRRLVAVIARQQQASRKTVH